MKSCGFLIGLLIEFCCAPVISQEFSTLGEIYDFYPGDEFQYIEYNCCNDVFFQWREVSILERIDSQDSILYVRKTMLLACVNISPPIITDTLQNNLIDTLIIQNPDSIIFNAGDEIIQDDSLYNRRKICINYSTFMGKPKIETYVDGCGLAITSWVILPDSNCRVSDSLAYFKKGQEYWGTKLFSTHVNQFSKQGVRVYPNPVINSLFVKLPEPNSIFFITLYDLSGRQIASLQTNQNEDSYLFDLSQFKKGVYLLHIFNEEMKEVYRVIKR